MTQHEFLNRLRSLYNIDGDQLPELSQDERGAFLRDPVRYVMRCNDAQAAAIWREIEKRQKPSPASAAPDLVKRLRAIELRVDGLNNKKFKQKPETQLILDVIKAHCRAALAKAGVE